MIEKSIVTPSGKIYYWVSHTSHDKTILFCHGLTADHHLFDNQVVTLSEKYNIIVWDMPLHGLSRPYMNFSYKNTAELMNQILASEKVNEVVLVGQSAGGYISQYFIQTYPEKVIGFVGVGTTPIGKAYYSNFDRFFLKRMASIVKLYPFPYYCKLSSKSVAYTEATKNSMYKTLNDLGREDTLFAIKAVYDGLLSCISPIKYKGPVLLTYGEFDKTGFVKKYNLNWSKENQYDLKVIKNASHNANYDNYLDFNQYLTDFMELRVK